jgi:hypothetical protein
MVQPETWKAIGENSSKAWSAVGPLVGVLIGAWLARAWDREKWEKENRKEECRELIKTITHAATLRLVVGRGTSEAQAYSAYLDSLKTIHDRVFIAADLERHKLLDSWAHAVADFGAGAIDAGAFSDRLDALTKTIIGFVIPRR